MLQVSLLLQDLGACSAGEFCCVANLNMLRDVTMRTHTMTQGRCWFLGYCNLQCIVGHGEQVGTAKFLSTNLALDSRVLESK